MTAFAAINFELLLAYIFAVILLIITPGPVVALVLRNTLLKGFAAGFLTIIGTNLASLVLIALAICIILGLFKLPSDFLLWLSLLGSGFIFYLGFSSFIESLRSPRQDTTKQESSPKGFFSQGFLIAISNPKDIVFFIAFFPQFINIAEQKTFSFALLVGLWILLDFSILAFYAFLGGKDLLLKHKILISRISDIVLMCVGIFGVIYHLRGF